ncbi:MAG: hypothetical protein IPP79_20685 [Chitinophagaceae bacterium]|nr:hypothetical protein [Chitinophagaceae bacterium]
MEEKLAQTERELVQIQETQIKGTAYELQADVWQYIAEFQTGISILEQETNKVYVLNTKPFLNKVSGDLTALISAIPKVKKDELDDIFHIQIYGSISTLLTTHDKIKGEGSFHLKTAQTIFAALSKILLACRLC